MSSNTTTALQPLTVLTTWERHAAGYPPRGAAEQARYRELGQCGTRCDPEPEAGQ